MGYADVKPQSVTRIVVLAAFALAFAGVPSSATAGSGALTEWAKIQALLELVEHSQVTFTRNGVEHTPVDAWRHLERKLGAVGSRVQTARDFIDHIASRSSITGRPYPVSLPGETQVPTRDWLLDRLSEIEAKEGS